MPTKTAKGGANNKAHNRGSSTSSIGKLNLAAFSRNKSAEKLKRNSSENHVVRYVSPHRRAQSPAKRPTVLQVDVGGDDDEWVSSESGAVTPADYDEHDAPPSPDNNAPDDTPDAELDHVPSTTPRADRPPAPPLPPPAPAQARPRPQSMADLPRVDTIIRLNTQAHPHQDMHSPDSSYHAPPTPTRRPASVRSARPHPLIRARSYATAPATAATTAPVSSSPHSSTSPDSELAPRTLRRPSSRSSVTSIATLPLPSTTSVAATARMTRVHGERQRLLSLTSTSAALSSLAAATHAHAHARASSRPPSPQFVIAFPPAHPRDEHPHIMIPPPLVPPHASATAHQNPFRESLRRVAEAKARAGR